ncbi:MAG: two-component regulator propeller domain-containing protein [bacterium]
MAFSALVPATACAQARGQALSQLDHTAWKTRNGAPAEVDALAQTADGFLWLGTSTGLYRFDGVRFERFVPPAGTSLRSASISALLALPDGALWIGYRFGGASLLARGQLTNFGAVEGVPEGSLYQFVRDSSGTMWALCSSGLARLAGAKWERVGAERGVPETKLNAAVVDRRGTLWANGLAGVFALKRNTTTFVRMGPSLGNINQGALREAPDGEVWGMSVERQLIPLSSTRGDSESASLRHRVDATSTMLIDSHGTAWFGTDKGIGRLPLSHVSLRALSIEAPLETMAPEQGLSSGVVTALLEDREHNIWVGTPAGLDRFRAVKFTRAPLPWTVVGPSVAAGAGDTIWSGSFTHGPAAIINGEVHVAPQTIYSESATTDDDGVLWLGNNQGLFHSSQGRFVKDSLPPELASTNIQSIARQRDGTMWLSVLRRGVYRRANGAWTQVGNAPAITIVTDHRGGVWLGYPDNRVEMVGSHSIREYGSAAGLRIGNVLAILPHGDDAWVGGELGFGVLRQGRYVAITGAGAESFRGVSGIVETANGDVWLNGADGITRLPAIELAHAAGDSSHRVAFERFDYRDGIDGTPPQVRPLPSAIAGRDGRLWFSTNTSVLWIDPASIRRNRLRPPVEILSVDAGGASHPASRALELPRRTTAVQINYTALSLSIPERVRFRYQLSGTDTTWQEAGNRRVAYYTGIAPGVHRFRVVAANEDGVWNDEGATMDIEIPPTFAQTNWFIALCALAAMVAIWMLFVIRHRQVARAIQARFAVTLEERTRIARELHDTLLQNFTGVTLQLYAVQSMLTARSHEASAGLGRAIADADVALREARYMVWDMRLPELDQYDLPDALAASARSIVAPSGIDFQLTVVGNRRRVARAVEVTAFRIGREAVVNAVRHAKARRLELTIDFAPDTLTLGVRDDGCGFSEADADYARTAGHWGLAGMRERAAEMNGRFTIDSPEDGGTLVAVVLPLDGGE